MCIRDSSWEIHALNPDGSTGERLTTDYNSPKIFFEPGKYRLITKLDQLIQESDLTLTADSLAAPEIVMNGARAVSYTHLDVYKRQG